MTLAFTILCAIVPSLLLLRYFYKRDLNPEPRGVLIKTFLFGILIVVPVVMVALPVNALNSLQGQPVLAGFYSAFLCAAIPEELFKFLVVLGYSARHSAFDEPMDGIVYGATASLGFATLENILYVAEGGWTVALMRAFTAVPCHACLGAILGYYVGRARFDVERKISVWVGFLAAVLLHGLYDFPLLTIGELDVGRPGQFSLILWLFVLFLAVFISEIVWTLRIVRRLRREQVRIAASQEATIELAVPPIDAGDTDPSLEDD